MDPGRQLGGAGPDCRMQQRFQFVPGVGVAEHQLAQRPAVERAVRRADLLAKARQHLPEERGARSDQLARQRVHIDNRHAELREQHSDRALAAGDPAGECDAHWLAIGHAQA